jgi:hypothetical protein
MSATAIVATASATAAISAAATTTVATAAVSSATAISATAAASWRARFARACFVHGQRTAFDGFAVQLTDCFLCVGFIAHCDESKAARFAGKLILHQHDFVYLSDLGEKVLKIGLGGVKGKISYVEFSSHWIDDWLKCSSVFVPDKRISNRH